MTQVRENIRNIAIIAHVDHGKTTLVDGMLKQSRVFRENQTIMERVMDSNDLERERGITILAKNTAVTYRGVKINIVDTPGHADFGGEVERVLNMVDGVLLLVDAVDGPMSQTRFVLRKALELGHRAIVVVNKVDRPQARPIRVANKTFDLFIELGATDDQADFPIVYTDAITGRAGLDASALTADLQPLFEAILGYIPAPRVEPDAPAQLLVANLSYDDYKGRIAVGRLFAGRLRRGQEIARLALDGTISYGKLAQLFVFQGLERVEVEAVEAGEIVALAGLPEVYIGETVADPAKPRALPPILVEAPTVRMTFGVNTSPFAGREGTWSTSRKLRERLYAELERNVALRVQDTNTADTFIVSGRGELHLAILIETMRREGYEFQVSRPEVIYRQVDGQVQEPVEQVFAEVPEDLLGVAVELLGSRRGRMTDMRKDEQGTIHLEYIVPTRGLLGFHQQFLTATRGQGTLHALFAGYEPLGEEIPRRAHGSLVAWEAGIATAYGLSNAEERGTLFIGPGTEVYEGMIVGERPKEGDLEVNVCKKKKLTNMHVENQDQAIRLTPPRLLSLDDAIEYIAEDELVEVTPRNIRLRKRILSTHERRKVEKDRMPIAA